VPKKFFKKYLPSSESIKQKHYLRWFGSTLHHPNLWHLNRYSVSGGVAVGMFTGLFPPGLQMGSAAIGAIIFRVNLPVAVFTTLYTNAFTTLPLYILAYQIGAWLMGADIIPPPSIADLKNTGWTEWIPAIFHWIASLGMPFVLGNFVLATLFTILGYWLVRGGWRLYVVLAWRRRKMLRQQNRTS
jgi:uncharacterized protein (DUF2062 family)